MCHHLVRLPVLLPSQSLMLQAGIGMWSFVILSQHVFLLSVSSVLAHLALGEKLSSSKNSMFQLVLPYVPCVRRSIRDLGAQGLRDFGGLRCEWSYLMRGRGERWRLRSSVAHPRQCLACSWRLLNDLGCWTLQLRVC